MVCTNVWEQSFLDIVDKIEVTEDSKYRVLKSFMENYINIYEKAKGVTRAVEFKVSVINRNLQYTIEGNADTFDRNTVDLMRREALLSYYMSQQSSQDRYEYKSRVYPNIEVITEYCKVEDMQKFIDAELEIPITLGVYYNNKYSNEAYTLKEVSILNSQYNKSVKMLRRNYLHTILDSAYNRGEKRNDIDKLIYLAYMFTSTDSLYNSKNTFDYEILPKLGKRDKYLVGTFDGERLASKKEIASKSPRVFVKKEYATSPEKYKMLNIICWIETGKEVYARLGGIEYKKIDVNRVKASYKLIEEALVYYSSKEFQQDMRVYMTFTKPIEYPDTIEGEEDVEEVSIEKMLRYIKAHLDSTNEYDNIALSIAKTAIRNKNYKLSEKQLKVVNNVYYKIADNKTGITVGKENKYTEDLKRGILALMQNTSRRSTVYSICEAVLNRRSCSPKQYEIIQEKLREISNKRNEMTNTTGSDLSNNVYVNAGIDIARELEGSAMKDGVFNPFIEEDDIGSKFPTLGESNRDTVQSDMIDVGSLSDILGNGISNTGH